MRESVRPSSLVTFELAVGKRPTRAGLWATGVLLFLVASTLLAPLGSGVVLTPPSGPIAGGVAPAVTPSFLLSPDNGTVGTPTSAMGAGFPANSSIEFTFGGTRAPTQCAADASGGFPGATGTSCRFVVPSAPAGAATVIAESDLSSAGFNIGSTPEGVAYDSGTGQVFVANFHNNTVGVISDSTDALVATVPVGQSPYSLAYDNGTGQVFVSNYNSNNVSVINDSGASKDTVVATVAVANYPIGVAYDYGTHQVFVANSRFDTVSVISDLTDTIVATVTISSTPGANDPTGVAYDPSGGELFVSNNLGSTVSVVPDHGGLKDQVVATVPVSGYPTGLVYDPSVRQVFVANEGNANVSVISALTDKVVATVPVGGGPSGVAYDPGTSEVFVSDFNSDNVSVISDATDLVNGTVPVGTSPYGVVYDAGTGQVFVANSAGDSVSVISPSSVNTSISFTMVPDLVLSPDHGPHGSTVDAAGTAFPANSKISLDFGGAAVTTTCSSDLTGTFPGTSGTPCTFVIPTAVEGPYLVSASNSTSVANATYTVDHVLLSPSTATVGSTVTAAGTEFPVNSSISLSVGGVLVPSECRADATGSFPGTTGSPCSFTVPAVPGGAENLSARAPPMMFSSFTGIPVGSYPSGVAFDPSAGLVFVTNLYTNTVSVISDATDAVVGSIGTGNLPYALAYDPKTDQLFVTNAGDNTVNIVDVSNDTNVATLGVVGGPIGAAYDSGSGQVFIAGAFAANVSVISGATDTVVATIPVGLGPNGVAYDNRTGQVFVANDYDCLGTGCNGSVSIINDSGGSADTVVATVQVMVNPSGVAYDAGTGQVFVTDQSSNVVSVISDRSDTVVATVPVEGDPDSAAYDSDTGQVFVTNDNNNTVSVISDTTDTSVATVPVGSAPQAIGYDPHTGQTYVADALDDNLTVINNTGGASLGSAPFTVEASLGLNSSVDVGQSITLQGNGFGSSVSLSSLTLGSFLLTCTTASVGSCISGAITTDSSGSFVAQCVVPAVAASGTYPVNATDTVGNNASVDVSVLVGSTTLRLSATPMSVDLGQSTTFAVGASFGTGSYVYAWSGLPPGCTGAVASILCSPSTTGDYSVSVQVTDTNGYALNTGILPFTVYSDPTVGMPVADPVSAHVDAGQTVNFTAPTENGTGNYASYAWSGLPSGCVGAASSVVTCSGTDFTWGAYSISVTVTDSDGVTSASSPTLAFSVNQDPTVTTPVATRPSADAGQSVTFSVSAGLGSGGYSFAWTGLPTGCGGSTAVVTCTVSGSGAFTVSAQVTDSNNFTVDSSGLPFTAYASPTVNLTGSRDAFDVGQSVTLTATGGSGSGAYTYTWSGLPTGCRPDNSSATCSFADSGRYPVRATVTDSNGLSAESVPLVLAVSATVTASISETTNATTVGANVTFTSSGTGGTGALSYAWEFGDGSRGAGATAVHAYASAGAYTVTLWVNDTVGSSVEKTLSVTVSTSSSGSTGAGGLGSLDEVLAIVGGVVVVGAIGGWLLVRRRRNRGSSPEESGEPASPTEDPDTSDALSADDPS